METKKDDLWNLIVALEPKLELLRQKVADVKDDESKKYFCANSVWYGYGQDRPRSNSFKGQLSGLVGWYSIHKEHPILGSCEAYSVAYRTIYEGLPNCRNCSCL